MEQSSKELQLHVDGILAFSKQVEERHKFAKEKEKKLQEMEEKIKESANKAKNKIKFDVGGETFTVSKEALLREEGSYFYHMLASDQFKPDEDGE